MKVIKNIILIILVLIIILTANTVNAVNLSRSNVDVMLKTIYEFSRVGTGEEILEEGEEVVEVGIQLDPTYISMETNQETTITATILLEELIDKRIIWESDNEDVASVNNGKVTTISEGTAVITAKVEGEDYYAECLVKVENTQTPVTGVILDTEQLELVIGDEVYVVAIIFPTTASNKNVTWESSNTNVATVTNDGKITAISDGTAIITVKTEDGNYESSCNVTVGAGSELTDYIVLSETNLDLKINETYQLEATVVSENTEEIELVWESQNTLVATVNQEGLVEAIGLGEAVIVCKSADGELIAGCIVNVNNYTSSNIPVTNVELIETEISLKPGSTYLLSAKVTPTYATETGVQWYSMDTNIARVTENGLVIAVSEGNTRIQVTTKDGGFTVYCTVHISEDAEESGNVGNIGDAGDLGDIGNIKLTGVSLNKTSVNIKAGATTTLKVIYTPTTATNKNVIWSSSNSNVAKVTETGFVIAMSEGEAIISVLSEDGNFISTCAVKVEGNIFDREEEDEEDDKTSDEDITLSVEPYQIISDKNMIIKISEGTTVTEFLEKVKTNVTKNIYTSKDGKMQGSSVITTGSYLKLNETITYKLIVTGDINGDGKITAVDLSRAKAKMVDSVSLEAEQEMAVDTNHDGKITAVDLSRLKQALVGQIQL